MSLMDDALQDLSQRQLKAIGPAERDDLVQEYVTLRLEGHSRKHAARLARSGATRGYRLGGSVSRDVTFLTEEMMAVIPDGPLVKKRADELLETCDEVRAAIDQEQPKHKMVVELRVGMRDGVPRTWPEIAEATGYADPRSVFGYARKRIRERLESSPVEPPTPEELQLIQDLPEKTRQVVLNRFCATGTVIGSRETARTLGMSRSTVQYQLRKAKDALGVTEDSPSWWHKGISSQ